MTGTHRPSHTNDAPPGKTRASAGRKAPNEPPASEKARNAGSEWPAERASAGLTSSKVHPGRGPHKVVEKGGGVVDGQRGPLVEAGLGHARGGGRVGADAGHGIGRQAVVPEVLRVASRIGLCLHRPGSGSFARRVHEQRKNPQSAARLISSSRSLLGRTSRTGGAEEGSGRPPRSSFRDWANSCLGRGRPRV